MDQTGRSALHYCAEYSRFDCAEFLLNNIPEAEAKQLIDIADHEGFTALLISVINGNIQLLGLLIGKGANVDAQDRELHTPVHWATGKVNFKRSITVFFIRPLMSVPTANCDNKSQPK